MERGIPDEPQDFIDFYLSEMEKVSVPSAWSRRLNRPLHHPVCPLLSSFLTLHRVLHVNAVAWDTLTLAHLYVLVT